MTFHDHTEGEYTGDKKDARELQKLLEKSNHLGCHQINNMHICVCRELIAVCPQSTDPITGEVSGQTMIIPMRLFMEMSNVIAEEILKDAISNATTRKDAKLN